MLPEGIVAPVIVKHGEGPQGAVKSRHSTSCFGKPQLTLRRADAKPFFIEFPHDDNPNGVGGVASASDAANSHVRGPKDRGPGQELVL